jgi:hypothetical protein
MIGGLAISFIMELLIYPIIFYLYKYVTLRHAWRTPALPETGSPAPVLETSHVDA